MYDALAILVNYNSNSLLQIESILLRNLSVEKLQLKLILVDNGSVDGSDRKLEAMAKNVGLDIETVRLTKNIGFTKAVNLAWKKTKSIPYRYLILINNDLFTTPGSVTRLIQELEASNYAGIQGTIMQMLMPDRIDNAGFVVDRWGLSYPVCRGYPISCAKKYEPSYLSGAFSIYKKNAIEGIGGPFNDFTEAYFDDKYLGIRLLSHGYKLLHLPLKSAFHLGSATYGKRRTLKSSTWFRNVAMAELMPLKRGPKVVDLLVVAKFITAASIADLLSKGRCYTSELIQVIRTRSALIDKMQFQITNSYPLPVYSFLIQNHKVGVRV